MAENTPETYVRDKDLAWDMAHAEKDVLDESYHWNSLLHSKDKLSKEKLEEATNEIRNAEYPYLKALEMSGINVDELEEEVDYMTKEKAAYNSLTDEEKEMRADEAVERYIFENNDMVSEKRRDARKDIEKARKKSSAIKTEHDYYNRIERELKQR